MSAWESAAVAIVPNDRGVPMPVILQFAWAEPERDDNGVWIQNLRMRESVTQQEVTAGNLTARWRWMLTLRFLLNGARKFAENEVIRMLESGELLINEEDET